jgi:hypothetical protein
MKIKKIKKINKKETQECRKNILFPEYSILVFNEKDEIEHNKNKLENKNKVLMGKANIWDDAGFL